MTRFCRWLVLLGLVSAATLNVMGQIMVGNVQITEESGSTVMCPGGGFCGMGYTPSGGHSISFHSYTGPTGASVAGTQSQTFLNSLGGPTFTTCSGFPNLCWGLLVNTSVANVYRQPGSSNNPDQGYYLTTTSTSNPIKLQFGTNVSWNPVTQSGTCTGCISEFSLYWGSVDSWNTITFTDAGGQSVSFLGSKVATANSPPITLGQNDVASFVYDFQLIPPSGATVPAWQTVYLSSSSPAFEVDNLSWVPTTVAIMGSPITAPTPEPSSLLLALAGCTGIAGWIRTRLS